jgi:hypothetical protein
LLDKRRHHTLAANRAGVPSLLGVAHLARGETGMRYLIIKAIFPPETLAAEVNDGPRRTEEIKVGVLESASIGDILDLEQILNRTTMVRFHVTVEDK